MNISIEQIQNDQDIAAMMDVRQQVFERELGIVVRHDTASANTSYWLARLPDSKQAIGTLSVVNTTGQCELHESLGLRFEPEARVARFIHLAVLKPYRGMNVPLAMMLEIHRSVIAPGDFDYTWLLFDAGRAARSFLSRQLGFTLLPQTFVSEYGCRCPLVRNERTPTSARAIRRAESYLERWNVEASPFAISA